MKYELMHLNPKAKNHANVLSGIYYIYRTSNCFFLHCKYFDI